MSEKENSSHPSDSPESIDLNSLTDLSFGPSWADKSSSTQKYSHTQIDNKAESPRKKDKRSAVKKDRRGSDNFRKKQGASKFPRRKEQQNFNLPIKDPKFDIKIYPQDDTFEALIKQLKANFKTYQLFGITRTILEKNERFVVLVNRVKKDSDTVEPIFFTPKDNMPFETEGAAIDHFSEHFLGDFFEVKAIETEAPKGNFSMIYRCPFTQALIGPPNYHRYQDLLKAHHKSKIKNFTLDAYQAKLEGVHEEAIVNEWIEQMKQGEQFSLKSSENHTDSSDNSDSSDSSVIPEDEADGPSTIESSGDAESIAKESIVFNTREAAMQYLLANCKDSVVRSTHNFRFSGAQIEALPKGELKDTILHTVHLQQRFPLETANNIRGRLRRHKFTIYKKGPKGISFVCCVKRKFRDKTAVFTDSITKLIQYIEAQSTIDVQNLPFEFLSIPKPSEDAQSGDKASESANRLDPANFSEEVNGQVKEVLQNLRWLISEGYVTEYEDGTLYVHPLLDSANAQKKEKIEAPEKTQTSQSSDSVLNSDSGSQAVAQANDSDQTQDENLSETDAADPLADSSSKSTLEDTSTESQDVAESDVTPSP